MPPAGTARAPQAASSWSLRLILRPLFRPNPVIRRAPRRLRYAVPGRMTCNAESMDRMPPLRPQAAARRQRSAEYLHKR